MKKYNDAHMFLKFFSPSRAENYSHANDAKSRA